ncbi:MAG: cyclopropane-fatty-acyl-phospholipid synthase family protein [Candidatus Andersenbacteria bacterium]
MSHPIITQLKKVWRGPTIAIEINNKEERIGKGTVSTSIAVLKPNILWRIAKSLSLGFGEAYMKGDIKIRGDLMKVLEGFYKTSLAIQGNPLARMRTLTKLIPTRISMDAAKQNAQHHYDVGNDFYASWLDPQMVYSCAYFVHENDSLEQAQRQKLELLCRKARLQKEQSLLDIGCGWGGLLFHAVERYGVTATGITPAKNQAAYIREEAKKRGLESRIQVIEGDWRELSGTYDRIISVGMFEHVGKKQYQTFFDTWNRLLADDGVSVLHTIGRMKASTVTDPWIRKYIFPGGFLPALEEMTIPAASSGLVVTDVENLWRHYAKTLQHWSKNFRAVQDQVISQYDEKFARMWWLYLQGSEAGFRWGDLQLWQLVLTKDKVASWPLNREVGTERLDKAI